MKCTTCQPVNIMQHANEVFRRLKLINISIRTKLLLIYLFCVLIPTIIFSSTIYTSTLQSARKEKLILYRQSVDRISAAIEVNAISAIELSNLIYPDEAMYDYINRLYDNRRKCLDDYNAYLKDAWSKVLPYNTSIVLFTVFTDNGTLLNGNHLHRIDGNVLQTDWYQKYALTDGRAAFLAHTDEVFASSARVRSVSFFRKLNYLYSQKYNHFVKITFQPTMLGKILSGESLPGTVYVIDNLGNVIAQTNRGAPDTDDALYPAFDTTALSPDAVVLESSISAMEGWRVVCVLDEDFAGDAFRVNWLQMMALIAATTVFASAIIYAISSSLYKRISMLVEHMGKVSREEYNLISESDRGGDEVGLLISSMNKMITKIRLLIEDVYKAKLKETRLELLKKQSELNALQCQVNPHFMFNVLETIRIKAYLRNEFETSRIVKYMSRLFRKLLTWNDDLIALRDELDFIKEYLEIQQYRYEEEMDFEITADPQLLELRIPKMTLQSLVDNACEHGLSETGGLKKIRVTARLEEGRVELKVYDNGKGMTAEQLNSLESSDSPGIGIKNVLGRLRLYFDERCSFRFDSEPGKYTEITLTLDHAWLKEQNHV